MLLCAQEDDVNEYELIGDEPRTPESELLVSFLNIEPSHLQSVLKFTLKCTHVHDDDEA